MPDLYSFKTIGWLTLIFALIIAGCATHTDDEPPRPTTTTNTGITVTAPGINIQVSGEQQ